MFIFQLFRNFILEYLEVLWIISFCYLFNGSILLSSIVDIVIPSSPSPCLLAGCILGSGVQILDENDKSAAQCIKSYRMKWKHCTPTGRRCERPVSTIFYKTKLPVLSTLLMKKYAHCHWPTLWGQSKMMDTLVISTKHWKNYILENYSTLVIYFINYYGWNLWWLKLNSC